LYLLLTRVVLPNLIIENRQYIHVMYSRYPHISANHPLRYDAWENSAESEQNLAHIQVIPPVQSDHDHRPNIPLGFAANIHPRPIFRSTPTPDGGRFLQWLNANPQPLAPGHPVPAQMTHRASELDHHLAISELAIRGFQVGDLLRRTVRVLNIFWWLVRNNSEFEQRLRQG
jgi:hypothetical protein